MLVWYNGSLQLPGGGGAASAPTPVSLPLLSAAQLVYLTAPTLVGGAPSPFDPGDYAVDGFGLSIEFCAAGSVSRSGLSGVVELIDDLDAVAATRTFTSTSLASLSVAVAAPVAPRLYRVSARLASSAGDDDYLSLSGASLRLSWSPS